MSKWGQSRGGRGGDSGNSWSRGWYQGGAGSQGSGGGYLSSALAKSNAKVEHLTDILERKDRAEAEKEQQSCMATVMANTVAEAMTTATKSLAEVMKDGGKSIKDGAKSSKDNDSKDRKLSRKPSRRTSRSRKQDNKSMPLHFMR